MVDFPAYVDGEPPVISLQQFDTAEWAKNAAVDSTEHGYFAVEMNNAEHVICKFDDESAKALDEIFHSAKQQFIQESVIPDLQAKVDSKATKEGSDEKD